MKALVPMWRTRLIPLAAFVIAASLAGPAGALDRDARMGPFVEGALGDLKLDVGDSLSRGVPGETALTPALRELTISPAGDPGKLLYFTPSVTLGGATVNFGGAYGTISPFPSGDIGTARLGGGVDFGSLRFGASYDHSSGALLADTGARQRGFDLGAAYDIGNFTTGLTWSRGVYRDFFASSNSSTATQEELSLSLSYRLSRGIDLIGALQYDQNDSTARPDSSSFLFGTAIRF